MVPGRFLFPQRDERRPKPRIDFIEHPPVTHLMDRLQTDEAARNFIRDWPLWAHSFAAKRPYFSPALFAAFHAAQLTGIDEIRINQISGKSTKPFGHVFR